MRFSDLPPAARVYVALVCGLTLAVLGLALAGLVPGAGAHASLELTLLIALAATIAHSFPVSTPGKQAYHVSLPMFVAAAVLLDPVQLMACIGLVNAVEHVRRRRSAFAQLFNVAAYSLAALAAQVTYHALWPDAHATVDLAQPGCLVAGLLGTAAFIGVNRSLVSVAIWLGNGIPLREQHMFEPESLLTEGVLLLMGLPLAHLAALAPWAAAVGAAPLWLIHRVFDLPNVRAQRRQDGLTELFTAPYLNETCTRELNRAKRFGRTMALVLLDVDGLGELNATYGPQAGDAVIRGTAGLLRKAIREYDLPARLAGGMFAVLLPETDLAQAQLVAERIRRSVAERRHELADSVEQVRVTVSIGVVIGGPQVESAARLFTVAEAALASAKRNGGNRIEFELVAPVILRPAQDPQTEPSTAEPAESTEIPARLPTRPRPRALPTLDHDTAANVHALVLGSLAVVAAAWALWQGRGGLDWSTLALLIGLAMLAETRSLDLFERSSFSMSSVPLLAACALLGPAGAALLAPAIAVVRVLTRRTRWQRAVVDTSAYLLAGVAAAAVYGQLGGPPSLEALPRLLLPAILAGLVFYLHTLPIALATAIELRTSPLRVWLDHFRWLWPQFAALGGLGLLLAVAYHVFGLIGAAAFAVPPVLMRYVTKQYLDRAVDNVRHLRSVNEQLEHRAFHDPLTDLANRALFAERLEHAFQRPESGPIAVLFLDLDNFKIVNDTLGHAAGDALLTIATQRLRQCVRWEDTIARLGGDEFTVLIENVRDVSDAARSAERIAEALAQPFDLDGHEAHVSASIGVALDTDRSHQPDDLMREADMAMYRAKTSGKSRYEIFDPGMNTLAIERLDMETELRHAAERGELVLHYQTLLGLHGRGLEALEAHLRWEHPRRGLLEPSEFMPLAEETGLVVELESWVLRQAARDAAAWQDQLPDVAAHVLLSARGFEHGELVDHVTAALATANLDAAHLTLGCVESVTMRSPDVIASTVRALRAHHVAFTLDAFGSGYSSLAELHRVQFDALTIAPACLTDPAILHSIKALAESLTLPLLLPEGPPAPLEDILATRWQNAA